MSLNYEDKVKIFKALSDQNRLEIINILSCDEKCACEILENFDITQPTLSHHMKVLIDCGLVECRKRGTWNHYKLNSEKAKELMEFLQHLFCDNKIKQMQKSICRGDE